MSSETTPLNPSNIAAVPLPRRSDADRNPKPPVWPLNSSPSHDAPLAAKCARTSQPDGVCCKELKGDDERTLIDPDVVRDV